MSLTYMYIRKSIGLRILPCGTPDFTGRTLEIGGAALYWHIVQAIGQQGTSDTMGAQLESNLECRIVSNAFLKSWNTVPHGFLSSIDFTMKENEERSCDRLDRLCTKANCCFDRCLRTPKSKGFLLHLHDYRVTELNRLGECDFVTFTLGTNSWHASETCCLIIQSEDNTCIEGFRYHSIQK